MDPTHFHHNNNDRARPYIRSGAGLHGHPDYHAGAGGLLQLKKHRAYIRDPRMTNKGRISLAQQTTI